MASAIESATTCFAGFRTGFDSGFALSSPDGIGLHHNLPDFRIIANLERSFTALAQNRPRGDVLTLDGVSIASPGVAFQMFNAAFLNAPVETREELRDRLYTAASHFARRNLPWSFWFCESWLDERVRRRLVQDCDHAGLRIAAEMPGMIAEHLNPPVRRLPEIDVREVNSDRTLAHFRAIGAECFRVPPDWFAEVFDADHVRGDFVCRVAYCEGLPVATSASIAASGVLGIYNVATTPEYRGMGYAEALTRRTIGNYSPAPVILQSTAAGLPLYENLGFRAVTKVIVFNSR